jgi:hypothetical protein
MPFLGPNRLPVEIYKVGGAISGNTVVTSGRGAQVAVVNSYVIVDNKVITTALTATDNLFWKHNGTTAQDGYSSGW